MRIPVASQSQHLILMDLKIFSSFTVCVVVSCEFNLLFPDEV